MYVANPRSITVSRECVFEVVVIKGVGNVKITLLISITIFYGLAIGELRGQLHHTILGGLCKTGLSWSGIYLYRCRNAENRNKFSGLYGRSVSVYKES